MSPPKVVILLANCCITSRLFLLTQGVELIANTYDLEVPKQHSPADPCLLKCKDDYMLSAETQPNRAISTWRVDSAIGSPLHALVDTVTRDGHALERIKAECSHHSQFVGCLHRCEPSTARRILSGGQETLKTICQSSRTDKEFANFVLPCLAKNGARIGRSCQLHWSLLEKDVFETMHDRMGEGGPPLEQGIAQLCRAMESYADCHLRTVSQLCHRRALPFFVRLNAKSSAALLRMLFNWANANSASNSDWPECVQQAMAADSASDGTPSSREETGFLFFAIPLLAVVHHLLLNRVYLQPRNT